MFSIVTPTIRPEGLNHVYKGIKQQTTPALEWLVEINITGETDFNQAMNKMIARAQGEWIVSVQDYIEIPSETLAYIATLPPAFYTFPIGKYLSYNDAPRFDWRKERNGDIHWTEWEICFGAAPREWLIAIGGFDEALDAAWGFDNVNVGYRAHQAGYPMKVDNALYALAWDHDAKFDHPLKSRRNEQLHNQRLSDFSRGVKVTDIQKYLV